MVSYCREFCEYCELSKVWPEEANESDSVLCELIHRGNSVILFCFSFLNKKKKHHTVLGYSACVGLVGEG